MLDHGFHPQSGQTKNKIWKCIQHSDHKRTSHITSYTGRCVGGWGGGLIHLDVSFVAFNWGSGVLLPVIIYEYIQARVAGASRLFYLSNIYMTGSQI